VSASDGETRRTIDEFNRLVDGEARALLRHCLTVQRWVHDVAAARPYADRTALLARAATAAAKLTDDEMDEALDGHPRIGERAGAGHDAEFSEREQARVRDLDGDSAKALTEGNRAYEARFGRVFLVRAAGRDTTEILAELRRRLHNDEQTERGEVVQNLREIALLRLEQLVG
jgi:2-oxo-4-hydroxy-4-carboxy-5-ureidoimidazoline decarboxylase